MRLIPLFFLLCFSSCLHAQPKTISLDNFIVEHGLPENYAFDIIQDKNGYMWIGTLAEFVRYDGYKVKVYKQDLLKNNSGHYSVRCLFCRQVRCSMDGHPGGREFAKFII